MSTPFFSVVVPVYNIPKDYLDCCINSLLCQTFGDFEVLLIDDGSKSECAEICDNYAVKDERIRVIHQENRGVSAARNNGINNANGEWIMFVDSDDWLNKEAFEKLRNHLFGKGYDMLMFRGVREKEHESVVMNYGLRAGTLYDLSLFETKEFLYRRAMKVPNAEKQIVEPFYYSWDKVYKRSFLIDNKLEYPVGLAKSEDKVFILLCLEKAKTLFHVNDALYHYRMNEESICHRYSADMDKQRRILSAWIEPIANSMDKELSKLGGQANYSKISEDYKRFMFGSISDVLMLKYYHEDNPDKSRRRRDAVEFLKSEPFRSIINDIPYSSLSKTAKIKKFLLKHGFVEIFEFLRTKTNKQ